MTYEDELKTLSIKVYYNGLRDGITMYAHWRDGTQYVGTCGSTLASVIKSVNMEEEMALSKIQKAPNEHS